MRDDPREREAAAIELEVEAEQSVREGAIHQVRRQGSFLLGKWPSLSRGKGCLLMKGYMADDGRRIF